MTAAQPVELMLAPAPAAEPVLRLREKIDTIRQTVAKGASDAQLEMFLTLAERYQLDPFLKEIWFSGQIGIITSRDGYLKIAMRHPDYDGIVSAAVRDGDEFVMEPLIPTVQHKFGTKRGAVIGGYAVVFRKGRRPAVCYADMAEYRKSGEVWGKYQSAMICKVAEVMALKRQFGISGLVTEEEAGHPVTVEHFVPAEETEPFRKPVRKAAPAVATAATREEITNRVTNLRTECVALMGHTPGLEAFAALLGQHGAKTFAELLRRNDGFEAALRFAAELDERLETFRSAEAKNAAPAEEDKDSWLPEGFGEAQEAEANV